MVIFRQAKALNEVIMAMHRPVLFGALLVMVCATGARQEGVKEGLPRATERQVERWCQIKHERLPPNGGIVAIDLNEIRKNSC
jgi:hypothetical protein